jgi:CHAD domain-containing protein
MQLELHQVKKPIRDLRRSLRDLPANPPKGAVHNLRTRSRRLEAIGAALLPRNSESAHQLLKAIKPLRRSAGEVRDMDVLEAKVRSLLRQTHDPSFQRLLAHLKMARAESAHELVDKLARDRRNVRHCLKRLSKDIESHACDLHPDPNSVRQIVRELRAWPRLSARNLHAFRIRIKELCYLLPMMAGANAEVIKTLEGAKTRIGSWHDWEELHRIAKDTLDPSGDRDAMTRIAEIERTKLKLAMNAAQSLRSNFLGPRSSVEFIEP